MIGLMVFLGLLGTFLGVATDHWCGWTSCGVDRQPRGNFETMMTQLRTGLDAPLSGANCIFIIAVWPGASILAFLTRSASYGPFFNELEDWLSALPVLMTATAALAPRRWPAARAKKQLAR